MDGSLRPFSLVEGHVEWGTNLGQLCAEELRIF